MRVLKKVCSLLILFTVSVCFIGPPQLLAEDEIGQWINHLDFLPGSDVDVKFNSVSVRGGGLEITPAATTPVTSFIQQGVQVPAGYLVNGVRVCYAQTGTGDSYIDRVTLLQLQDPPTGVDVVLDDDMTFTGDDIGPVCVNTAPQRVPVDPSLGALSMRFGVNFVDDADSVVILGVGLLTIPDPDSALSQLQDDVEQLNSNQERIINVLNDYGMDVDALEKELDRLTNAVLKHTHVYRTGKGYGHNKVEATSSTLTFDPETPSPKPAQNKKSMEKSKKKSKKK